MGLDPKICESIRTKIADGQLRDALELLRNFSFDAPSQLSDEAVALSGRLSGLSRKARQGILSDDLVERETAKIRLAALSLKEELCRLDTGQVGGVEAPKLNSILNVSEDTLADGELAENAEVDGEGSAEKILEVNRLRQIAWVKEGLKRSRAVCRIHTASGSGTGFLINDRVLMTCSHVISGKEQAVLTSTKAEFNYEMRFGEETPPPVVRYSLSPDIYWRTSPERDLDFTLVGVKPHDNPEAPPLDSWGYLELSTFADPLPNEHLAIVQHPQGFPKQIALEGRVSKVKTPYLHYELNTMKGTSGAPVFNDLWQVVAIHRAVGPQYYGRDSNEGVLMSSIFEDVGNEWPK